MITPIHGGTHDMAVYSESIRGASMAFAASGEPLKSCTQIAGLVAGIRISRVYETHG